MSDNAELKYSKYFTPMHYYTRTKNRWSSNYRELKKLIGREPDVIYPAGWWDYDIDRLIIGTHCVHHGIVEWKHISDLDEPFKFNEVQREAVIEYLKRDHFNIHNSTLNYSYDDRKGTWLDEEYYVLPTDLDYYEYLRKISRIKKLNKTLGKGVFLHLTYTANLEYFSVINFTNSQYVLGDARFRKGRNSLKLYLMDVGGIVEPCFNEVLLFMLEAYIRNDFYTLYDYFTSEEDMHFIRLDDKELEFASILGRMKDVSSVWFAFVDVMEWLLECIHFDTILEEVRNRRKPQTLDEPSYINLVELCQSEDIFSHLAQMISERYEWYESGSRKAS
jgi:hypothetical protein